MGSDPGSFVDRWRALLHHVDVARLYFDDAGDPGGAHSVPCHLPVPLRERLYVSMSCREASRRVSEMRPHTLRSILPAPAVVQSSHCGGGRRSRGIWDMLVARCPLSSLRRYSAAPPDGQATRQRAARGERHTVQADPCAPGAAGPGGAGRARSPFLSVDELRAEVRRWDSARIAAKPTSTGYAPRYDTAYWRYDAVYWDGLAWLERLSRERSGDR